MKQLSIIVPVYNVEQYLRKCIDSLVAITNIDYEILLIDDGSTDNSGLICDEYSERYADKITVIHKENGGVSSARNKGLELATGEWIYFCDADDWIESALFSNILLNMNNSANFIKFGYYINNKHGAHKVTEKQGDYNVCTDWQHLNYGGVWHILFRSKPLRKYNITFSTNIRYGEDQEFLIKYLSIIKQYKIIDLCIYHYNIREGSATNSTNVNKKTYTDLLVLLKNLATWFNKNNISMQKWMNIRFERIIKSVFINYSRCTYTYSNIKVLKKEIKIIYNQYKVLPYCNSLYFYLAKTTPTLLLLLLKIKYYKR